MNQTKAEREAYNAYREAACDRLRITRNQYNWLRRQAALLQSLDEQYCNGEVSEGTFETAEAIHMGITLGKLCQWDAANLGYHIYHQSDPRGCSLYLDTAPISEEHLQNAVAIY